MDNSNQDYIKGNNISSNSSSTSLEIPNESSVTITPSIKEEVREKKIGKNIIVKILGKKRIIGIPDTIFVFILTNIGMFITEFGWILSNNYFYPYQIYIFQLIFFWLTIYYMFICFFIDPGIIPRYNKNFQLTIEEKNKENNKENNKDNVEESDLNKKQLPSIFQERKCETCHIIKPPKTSHCRFCDNCIQGLDHHCFFISNCVGIRNHKQFFLFCIYGSFGCLLIVIFDFIHVNYVLFFSKFQLWKPMYKGNKYLLIISIILILLGSLYASSGGLDFGIISFTVGIGCAIFIYLFYKYSYISIYPSYYNPFSLVILGGSLAFFFFVFSTFCIQFINISSGYTIKQKFSIEKEFLENINKENNIDTSYIKPKNFKERINNLKRFFVMKRPNCLFDLDNDL